MDRETKAKGWFGPKRFGFGVGPSGWQGWLVMLAFVAGCICAARAFEGQPPLQLGAVAGLAVALAAIIFATYRRD